MTIIKRKQKKLLVKEIFTDIEGEGRYQGLPSVFVRLALCNLRCTYCDTRYSYSGGLEMEPHDVAIMIKAAGLKNVNITGGEPLLQKQAVNELIREIKKQDKTITVSIETNGSVSVKDTAADTISMDWKLPGSGESKKMLVSNLKVLKPCDQLKFIVSSDKDLEYASKLLEKHPVSTMVIVQPAYKKYPLKKIADFVLCRRLKWKVSLQLHKVI